MVVKVGTMPGRIEEYALDEGATVSDALAIADISTEGYQIKVNSVEADLGTELKDNDIVLLVKKIKGAR